MRATTIKDGEVLVVEHPDPEPSDFEVLVRVKAAGLNGADMIQLAGAYPAPVGSPPDIPGLELAGEVVANGPGATRFAEGDRVMGIVGGGGQGELCVVPEPQLMAVPDRLDWAAAGGFPEAFTTAHDAIVTRCGLAAGDRLLVHGAAGGVGTAAVQIGSALGARVTATVRDPSLREGVAALGAGAVLDPDGFAEHGPFDVILELVGAPNLGDDIKALAIGGRICFIGIGAGGKGELNVLHLMAKRGAIHGSTLRPRSVQEKGATARALERDVLPAVQSGAITVPIVATFPLDDVAAAYERFAAGAKLGKIVLTV